MVAVFIKLPESYQSIDNRLRDFLFVSRGQEKDSDNIRIVEIDEASLRELGQWPWERNKIAQLLQNLTAAGASIIALDVFFSEQDKSSPINIVKKLNLREKLPTDLMLDDYDQVLADTLAETPTLLGFVFDLQQSINADQFPMLNATITEKNFSGVDFLPLGKGVTLNLEKFQDKAMASGFINNIPDTSGMIRRIPLVIKYQDIIFTSLSLEVYRLLTSVDEINVNYLPTGISSIDLFQQENTSSIPTDKHGRLFLNFLGSKKSFTYLSAKDVINNKFDPAIVKDKIVLFGATAVGLLDLRATPFDNAMPGVEVHATAIENMLNQNFLQHPDWAGGATLLLIFAIGIILTLFYNVLPAYSIMLLMIISLYSIYHFYYYLLFQQGLIINILFPVTSIFLLTISSTVFNYFQANHQRKIIRDNFARKVSSSVVDEILKNNDQGIMLAQEKEISIFFSDIRGFTNISEQLASPTKLIDLLNIYMTLMVDSIMEKQGTVDKFIGDAIMAYWNAPNQVDDHADASIQSAIEQIKMLDQVNVILKQKYDIEIDIGIGINTGVATVGEMGSRGRSDYTIIGDSVNLASRLEGLCKPYGSKIIISQSTLQQAKQKYVIRELDRVRVKGKKEAITIYEVLDYKSQTKELEQQLIEYQIAMDAYLKGEFQVAKTLFDVLLESDLDNILYALYSERCQLYINNPPTDFDGVFTHTTK